LEQIFKQDLTKRDLSNEASDISRNAPCPCDSGEKYKKCCGNLE
jgi:uncharacterized protein YecA (UPF0149 family)